MSTTQPVAIGDYFAAVWGYDQTNVDFYRVVDMTPSGKSVRVVPVWAREVDADRSGDMVIPTDTALETRDGKPVPPTTYRLGVGNSIAVSRGHHAWPWNGRPLYRTPAGYGH